MTTIETTPNGVTIRTSTATIKIEPRTLQEANHIAAAFRAAHKHIEQIPFNTPCNKEQKRKQRAY